MDWHVRKRPELQVIGLIYEISWFRYLTLVR